MKPPFFSRAFLALNGFTFVEMMVVIGISILLLITLYKFFSGARLQSRHNESLLVTISDVEGLMRAIQKDVQQSTYIDTKDQTGASKVLLASDFNADNTMKPLPSTFTLVLCIPNLTPANSNVFSIDSLPNAVPPTPATITYSLDKNGLKRRAESGGTVDERIVGAPKVKEFRAVRVSLPNPIDGSNVFSSLLFLELMVQSDDQRDSRKPVKISTFFSLGGIATSSWNSLPPVIY
ncbi:MAG: type II secretion system protein [Candidatus Riflebacteria bacterium]|nr:type II secretion system protein [Candidatus Riflebacteria bacterium]